MLREIAAAVMPRSKGHSVPSSPGGWYPLIREAFTGAWQRNIEVNAAEASTFYAVFACQTLIARDIAKLPVRLVEADAEGIWSAVNNPAYSPVLRKPNHFQTRNQFVEHWILSKLSRGNTYVLKIRDKRRVVTELFVLDPRRATPLIASDGSVFYQIDQNEMNGMQSSITVPATEIIHDRMNCLFHPLVGIAPIYASGLAAMQGLNIQNQSVRLFANNATPGGILTAPGHIEDATAARLKADWEQKFGASNYGRLAVLGDGLEFKKMSLTAVEGQMIEQLKWTAEVVCSTFHVPPYKIGVGAMPSYNNVQALNLEYYTQCLQSLIEDMEACLDEGLGLGEQYALGTEFDIENLLRMDTATQMDVLEKGKNYLTPDEGRKKLGLKKTPGGGVVYRQQQDFSLEALAKRDAQADPFGKAAATPAPAASAPEDPAPPPDDEKAVATLLAHELRKSLRLPLAA